MSVRKQGVAGSSVLTRLERQLLGVTMRRVLIGGLFLLLALAGVTGPVPSTAAPGPGGEIRVQGRAFEGQYDVISGTLRLRCRPGLEVAALGLTFTQDFVSPEGLESTVPVCDGDWHVQAFSSFEGFHPGRATVAVRMVLVDATTGAPRGEVTTSGSVYVRPGARVLLPQSAELRPGGVVSVRVSGRCDEPWILGDFIVSVSQFEGYAYGYALVDIPCDGGYDSRTVQVQSSGRQFARGWVRVDASLSTLDGVNFDPAVHATAHRAARVR